MILRRFVALVLAGSLLHLTSSRADAACAEHGGSRARMQQESADATDHHAHDGQAKTDACDTPTLPACCQMLVSCSTIHIASDAVRQSVMQVHLNVAAAVQRAPESRVATPDPPPPKR